MSQLLRIRNTALANGLRELLAQTQERLALKQPLHIYLAGGLAVHLYCGTRVTSDVDAEFSARVFLPPDLLVNVRLEDGTVKVLHFDTNYNSTFALMHEDYVKDSVETDLHLENVHLHVLSPVDLAVSKISRFADVDRADIQQLVLAGWVTPQQIEERASQALIAYVGGQEMLKLNLRDALVVASQAYAARQSQAGDSQAQGGPPDAPQRPRRA